MPGRPGQGDHRRRDLRLGLRARARRRGGTPRRPMARIGVHQITTLVKEPEGLARLTSTRKLYEQQGVDAEVSDYLATMGVANR